MRQPEHGLGGVPEGDNVLRCARQEEAQGREGAVELGACGIETFFCRENSVSSGLDMCLGAISEVHTRCLKLLEQLVVLAPQLCPLCKLVLAAGGVHLAPHGQIIGLDFSLLGGGLGGRHGEEVDEGPELCNRRLLANGRCRASVDIEIAPGR